MNAPTTFPIGAVQFQEAERQLAFRRLVALFERDEIEAAVDELIANLDRLDGDLDLEPNGDELDGNASEDDFMRHPAAWDSGPGCPLADPDIGSDDQSGVLATSDRSYAEWHTLPGASRRAGHVDGTRRDGSGPPLHEDVEDDDPCEEADGDHEHDGREREEGFAVPSCGVDQSRCVSSEHTAVATLFAANAS